ncbi:MAG: aminotransferase class I/II-fold pyridoxal phosphate-dependent enzyme, partial [Lewinella sp.]|nr:aminotransferase class I/II-fold pyridoxal phosphate-dependent enzyme [Lewinella sp.]
MQSKLPRTGTSIFSVMSALAHQHQAINLSQGFPNFDPPAELQELVYRHMQQGHNQYAPMPGLPALREVLAAKLGASAGYTPDPGEEITITSGATQALFTAITTVMHPGDEAILFEPAYDSYRPAVELCGGVVRAHRLRAPDYRVDWEEVAELLSPRTRLVIVNTPHNPTGTLFTAEDWEALDRLLADRPDVMVLSDEVYEHLIFDGATHRSLLHYPDLYRRGFATYSFGKTFHSTGWKVGYCVAPPRLMQEFRKVHQ